MYQFCTVKILCYFIETYLAYISFKIFFRQKIDSNFKIMVIITFESIILNILNMNQSIVSIGAIIIVFASYFIMNMMIFDAKPRRILIVLSVFVFIILVFEIIMMIIINIVLNTNTKYISNNCACSFIFNTCSRLLFYILSKYFINFKVSNLRMKKLYVYEMMLIFLISIFFIYFIVKSYKQMEYCDKNSIFVFATMLMIVFSILIINMFEEIIKYSHKEFGWVIKKDEYKKQLKYVEELREMTSSIESERYSFKNYLRCICDLLSSNEFYEAKEYAAQIASKIKNSNVSVLQTENSQISSILNLKYELADKKNISIKYNLNKIDKIDVPLADICIILGNAIDNAIDNCERIDGTKRFIMLQSYEKKNHIIIKVISSYINNMIEVDLEENKLELKNIKHIIEKYDGLMKIDRNKDIFKLNMALLKKR